MDQRPRTRRAARTRPGQGHPVGRGTAQDQAPSHEEDRSLTLTLALLKEINALCADRGMFFHVVLLVTKNTPEAKRWEIERLSGLHSSEKIKDSSFFSRSLPSTALWLDQHYSRYGHRLLAKHIAEILRSREE